MNAEIKQREHNLKNKVKTAHKDIKKMKLEIKEDEQKNMESDENYQRISEVVSLSCRNFEEEGITGEMALIAKVAHLAKIVAELKQQVIQLEEKRRPKTPP